MNPTLEIIEAVEPVEPVERFESLATSTSSALVLPAELTIYTVGELHPKWMIWLSEMNIPSAEGFAEVQAGAVDQVDAAGLQLLLSLEHALASIGRRHSITGASRALVVACAGLGLSSWLQAQTRQAHI